MGMQEPIYICADTRCTLDDITGAMERIKRE